MRGSGATKKSYKLFKIAQLSSRWEFYGGAQCTPQSGGSAAGTTGLPLEGRTPFFAAAVLLSFEPIKS